jgi:hypothetical protein
VVRLFSEENRRSRKVAKGCNKREYLKFYILPHVFTIA